MGQGQGQGQGIQNPNIKSLKKTCTSKQNVKILILIAIDTGFAFSQEDIQEDNTRKSHIF